MWGVALPKGPGVLGEIGNFLVLHNVLQWKKGGTTKEGGQPRVKGHGELQVQTPCPPETLLFSCL